MSAFRLLKATKTSMKPEIAGKAEIFSVTGVKNF